MLREYVSDHLNEALAMLKDEQVAGHLVQEVEA
jgi:hypothetical protein